MVERLISCSVQCKLHAQYLLYLHLWLTWARSPSCHWLPKPMWLLDSLWTLITCLEPPALLTLKPMLLKLTKRAASSWEKTWTQLKWSSEELSSSAWVNQVKQSTASSICSSICGATWSSTSQLSSTTTLCHSQFYSSRCLDSSQIWKRPISMNMFEVIP